MTAEGRARVLLAGGAVAGLVVAAVGLLGARVMPQGLPPEAIARVNGELIRREDFVRAAAGLASDRRTPLEVADQRYVLDRLIDEELLVQRGMALGLVRRDRLLRGQVVAAMIDLLAVGSGGGEPSREALIAFYREHQSYFAQPGRVRAQQVLIRVARGEEEARRRAENAAQRLRAGEGLAQVQRELGDDEGAPLPDDFLSAAKLREYVGETAARSTLELAAGEVSAPVRSSVGFHVVQALAREEPSVPAFEEIADLVRAEYRRRADEQALRTQLDALRARAKIDVVDSLP